MRYLITSSLVKLHMNSITSKANSWIEGFLKIDLKKLSTGQNHPNIELFKCVCHKGTVLAKPLFLIYNNVINEKSFVQLAFIPMIVPFTDYIF